MIAKILASHEPQKIQLAWKTATKQNVTIADATGAMQLSLWDNLIPKVQLDKSYRILSLVLFIYFLVSHLSFSNRFLYLNILFILFSVLFILLPCIDNESCKILYIHRESLPNCK